MQSNQHVALLEAWQDSPTLGDARTLQISQTSHLQLYCQRLVLWSTPCTRGPISLCSHLVTTTDGHHLQLSVLPIIVDAVAFRIGCKTVCIHDDIPNAVPRTPRHQTPCTCSQPANSFPQSADFQPEASNSSWPQSGSFAPGPANCFSLRTDRCTKGCELFLALGGRACPCLPRAWYSMYLHS